MRPAGPPPGLGRAFLGVLHSRGRLSIPPILVKSNMVASGEGVDQQVAGRRSVGVVMQRLYAVDLTNRVRTVSAGRIERPRPLAVGANIAS